MFLAGVVGLGVTLILFVLPMGGGQPVHHAGGATDVVVPWLRFLLPCVLGVAAGGALLAVIHREERRRAFLLGVAAAFIAVGVVMGLWLAAVAGANWGGLASG